MAWSRRLSLWCRSLLHRGDVERDLDDELAYHLERSTDALIASGVAPAAARATALRQLGSLESTKEAVRDTWHVRLSDHVRQDVTTALRALRRTPGATAVALVTLALGIGANTAVFSVINGVLVRPPYPDADRLFWMQERTPRGSLSAVSAPNYFDWQQLSETFEIASWGIGPPVTFTAGGTAVPLRVTYVAPNYFDVLRVPPLLGRTFRDGEQRPGRDRVAMLSHQLWVAHFAADPAIVGRSIRLRGEPHEVVGVMPVAASRGEWSYTEVWLPHTIDEAVANREYRAFNAYARLRSGVSQAQGEADMATIAAQLGEAYPASNHGWTVALLRYTDVQVSPNMRQSLYLLLGGVGAVLLIGCVNLANILLARSLAREREAAIRVALGGGRLRVLAQFATESVLLSIAGGVLGLLTAMLCLAGIRVSLPAFSSANASLPPADAVTIDGTVLVFALVVSGVTAVLCGILPARAATRIDLARVMKDRRGPGEGARLARRALVVAEVALTFVLVATAGLVVDTFNRVRQIDLGFDDRNLLTASLPLDLSQVSNTAAERQQYLHRLLEQVRAVPGVRAAALTSILPMQGAGNELPCQIDTEQPIDVSERDQCFFKMVTPTYFSTLGLPLLAGRTIEEVDRTRATRIAVVNQTLARQYGGAREAIGRRIVIPELTTGGRTRLGAPVPWEIVGVVANERVSPPHDEGSNPGVYVSLDQNPTRRPALVLRTDKEPRLLEQAVRRSVTTINPDQPLAEVRTFADIKAAALGSERQRAALLTVFALVSLLLAAVGIYGVLAYSVVQRTGELGLRAAIGASSARLMRLVLRDGLRLTLIGLAAGIVATFAMSRAATGLLFAAGPVRPDILAAAAAAVLGVALVACLIPARRATRVDPLIAIRGQ